MAKERWWGWRVGRAQPAIPTTANWPWTVIHEQLRARMRGGSHAGQWLLKGA